MTRKILGSVSVLCVLLILSLKIYAQEKFEKPILITSAGQSADVKLVKLLAKRQNIEAETNLMAQENNLDGIKTLIIVPGFSSKGLGAAGISQQDEMLRVKKIIAKAKDKNIPIIMIHVGGAARRGGQSDEFCQLIAEYSRYMIVVQQGNQDGLFTQIANTKKIPIKEVDKISDVGEPLSKLFSE